MRRALPIATLAAAALLAACTDDGGGAGVAPVVEASADPGDGPAPLRVEFTADASYADGDVGRFSYRWDFGDGEQSTRSSPIHTYAEEGTYQVTVEVTDDEGGATGADQLEIVVGPTSTGDEAPTDDEEAGDTETTEPLDADDGELVAFDDWADEVNGACAATVEAADQLEPGGDGTTLTDDQWRQLADLQRDETEAVDAAGIPDTRTDEAREWLDVRAEGAELFIEIVDAPPVELSDPRWADLDTIGVDLSERSLALGLDACAGGG